jgi:hypothetical protein
LESGRLAAKNEAKTSAAAERSSAAARTIGANFTAIVLVTAVALAEGVPSQAPQLIAQFALVCEERLLSSKSLFSSGAERAPRAGSVT